MVLVDGSVNEYTLPVQFFIHQPLALFLLLASIGIGISLLALLVLPAIDPASGAQHPPPSQRQQAGPNAFW
ncbi:MAG: hypothetical protein IPK17_09275 [Chloroflexi bacterium]|uniref:hypothetical protein n=1 Tax=Candidatus Flexifilum breve TaxID=3140694 RepID=UPI00313755B4|nr:hypothetical protein [Chloroflexota bacterium]